MAITYRTMTMTPAAIFLIHFTAIVLAGIAALYL